MSIASRCKFCNMWAVLDYAKHWIEENVHQERGRRRVPVYNSTQQPLYKMPAAGATQALRIAPTVVRKAERQEKTWKQAKIN